MRSTDRWLRQFYAEVEDVRKILFTPGRTAKGAKRLLKQKREHWLTRLTRPTPTTAPGDFAILADWCNQLDSYWPGLFHCYSDPRLPGTNVAMERHIKEMKQWERVISRNPNPAVRFTRHAAINATVITHPQLPGADFLASRSTAELQTVTRVLKAQRRKQGVASLVRRDMDRFKRGIVARWKEACAPPQPEPTTAVSR